MFKSIIIGVDGSAQSLKALATAVQFSQEFGSNLHVFHSIKHHYAPSESYVYPTLPVKPPFNFQSFIEGLQPAEPSVDYEKQFHEESGQKIIDQAQDFVRNIDPAVADSSEFHLETKLPPEDYVETFVKVNGADLVVLGCCGHHSGVKQLTGTVATRIMNAAPCKVLFVR